MKKIVIASMAVVLVAILALYVKPPRWEFAGIEAQVVAKPVPACRLELGGETVSLTSISDFKVECEVIQEFDEEARIWRKRPGFIKYGDLTLKSSAFAKVEGVDLRKWYQEVLLGRFEKKSGAIVVFDAETGEEYQRYNFFEAWPYKWHGPRMISTSAVIPVEEITLAIEKVEITK